jgi:hypothetical protein
MRARKSPAFQQAPVEPCARCRRAGRSFPLPRDGRRTSGARRRRRRRLAWSTSAADETEKALITPAPERAAISRTRLGVSLPCTWIRSGFRVAISRSTRASSGSTVTATVLTGTGPFCRSGAARRAAASGSRLRGLLAKNTKPTKAAPPVTAAATLSGWTARRSWPGGHGREVRWGGAHARGQRLTHLPHLTASAVCPGGGGGRGRDAPLPPVGEDDREAIRRGQAFAA